MTKSRRLPHNQPDDHKTRISLRKAQRAFRVATQRGPIQVAIPDTFPVKYHSMTFLPRLKASKYIPIEEDRKHEEKKEAVVQSLL